MGALLQLGRPYGGGSTVRRTGVAVLSAAVVGALVAGCGSATPGAGGSPTTSPAGTQAPPATSPLAPCADPAPAQPAPLDAAVAHDFADGQVETAFSLDSGAFRATPPPPGAKPRISRSLAFCNLLAGDSDNNVPLVEAAVAHGMSFGLALVSVADALLTSGAQGLAGVTSRTVDLQPYHARLAWIAVTTPDVAASCPAERLGAGSSATPPPPPSLPGYQVLAIDAGTGANGILYVAQANPPCGGSEDQPAHVQPAVETVSEPWTLVSRGPGQQLAMISYEHRPCDLDEFPRHMAPTGQPVVSVDRTHPGLVRVEDGRVLTTCGPAAPTHLLLSSATVTTDLPQHLVHAPVGAQDVSDRPG